MMLSKGAEGPFCVNHECSSNDCHKAKIEDSKFCGEHSFNYKKCEEPNCENYIQKSSKSLVCEECSTRRKKAS